MSSVSVLLYEPDKYARAGLEKIAEALKINHLTVTVFDNACLSVYTTLPENAVWILCTDTLFTAGGREWLTAVIKLNKTHPNIKLFCLCRYRLRERVRQTAILTGCRVQAIPVQSFAKAHTQLNTCFNEPDNDLPEGRLTPRERKVLRLLLVGISACNISLIMNISPKTVYSIKLRAMKRFEINHLNRLYYLRDAVQVI